MTIGNTLRVEGFKANCDVNGTTVTVTDTGLDNAPTFKALVYSVQEVDPSSMLGTDIREKDVIETLREWLPASILAATTPGQMTATIEGVSMVITKRVNNPVDPFVRFDVVKVV